MNVEQYMKGWTDGAQALKPDTCRDPSYVLGYTDGLAARSSAFERIDK